jgi:LysR family transcriptional regulator for metE and metH
LLRRLARLELRDLRLVEAVARCGTLTRAGRELHLTQSGLSHQLSDLEARLGARVFERLGRRMVLTPVGERLQEAGAEVLASLARAEDAVRATLADRTAVVRLATECYTCYHWLPPVLVRYRERFPQVETRIVAEATRRPIQALLDGHIDLAIASSAAADRRLEARDVWRDELVAAVAPGHPWAGRRSVMPEDFADQHLIDYSLSREESSLFQEFLLPAGVVPRRVSNVELTEAILELVAAGFGVAVCARWALARYLDPGTLVAVRLGPGGFHRTWQAVVRRRHEQPDYLLGFVDLLAAALRRGPGPIIATRAG